MALQLGWWLTPGVTGEMTNKCCVNICDDARRCEAAGAGVGALGCRCGFKSVAFSAWSRESWASVNLPPKSGPFAPFNTSCSGYREAILGNLRTCCHAQSPLGCTTNVHYKNMLAVPNSSKVWHTEADHHKKRLACFTFWGNCYIILCCVVTEFTFCCKKMWSCSFPFLASLYVFIICNKENRRIFFWIFEVRWERTDYQQSFHPEK